MDASSVQDKKSDELLHVIQILKEEFELQKREKEAKQNKKDTVDGKREDEDEDEYEDKSEDEGEDKSEEANCAYYDKLKKEKGIEVLVNENTNSLYISKKYNIEHNKLMGIIKKLETLYYIINIIKNYNTYHLTEEGTKYLHEGSPEYISFKFVQEHTKCTMEDIKTQLGKKGEIGISLNLKNKQVLLNKADKTLTVNIEQYKKEQDERRDNKKKENQNKNQNQNQNENQNQNQHIIMEDSTQTILNIIYTNGNDEKKLFTHLKKALENTPNEKTTNKKNAPNDICTNILQELKKRKLVEIKKNTYSYIIKTSAFHTELKKQITDLTYALLKNQEYKKYEIKKYNFFSSGKKICKGNFHLLSKQMKEFKEIFLSLGFEEMETNTYVESSFWCFDALYIPQQHPSRDLQDTFFTKIPEVSSENFTDRSYIENVKNVHSKGAYESFGWNYTWKLEESQKNVLRTHTTANSARRLYQLVKTSKQQNWDVQGKKYFSIDKVFRNENLDSTHLAEFHQVEGLVIGKNIGFGHLKGILSAFYKKIGINKLKFKPTFNPYTEPSMEVYGFHEEHNKWLEVGNSGVFRPELLRPMGFSKDISVVAWGLSLERPTMIKYNIKNIRDLVGYKSTT